MRLRYTIWTGIVFLLFFMNSYQSLSQTTITGNSIKCESKWEDISQSIFSCIPGYVSDSDKLFNAAGNLTVVPSSGDLYLTLNRNYGVFKSTDAGQHWQKLQGVDVQGRSYGGFSSCIDPQTGRFALFMIVSSVEPKSAFTLDGGKTWKEITRPTNVKHDGWTWGSVDWSVKNPHVIIGKQHHDMTAMWLSKDAGQTWEKLPFQSRNPGVINSHIFVAAKGENGEGIFRSTDQGQTWNQVSDFKVNGKIPVRWNENFYWTSEQGVIVSKDKGATWSLLGSALPGVLWGPFFGKDENTIVVIRNTGFYRTTDSGKNWEKMAILKEGVEFNVLHPTVSYGWDYQRNILYCSPVGGSVYRLCLDKNRDK